MDSFAKIVLASLATIVVFAGIYCFKLHYEVAGIRVYRQEKKKDWTNIALLFAAAFLVKIIYAAMYEGHGTDMNCFIAWSEMIFENGIGKFYYLDAFTDYPPGYMAILWVIAGIRHIFGVDAWSQVGRVLIKLVPILFDLSAGMLLYSMAKRKFSEGSSMLLAVSYVLNPIVVLDSSVWGQTDGVFTFCVLATCYLCMEKKRIPAYFVFVAGVLIKPQMLIFAPILIWTIIEQVFLEDFNWKKLIRDLIGGLGAIGAMFLVVVPFGLERVIPQYIETLGSYEYCTINAYNVWALLGKNWASQSDLFLGIECRYWGMLAIFAAVALSGFLFFKLKEDKSKYFISMSVV
ncbi:MAG: glycosyltransferase family 39 protein, partial [Eubacterium sp.]|nr:glycosyltransferase family 39 protein [Eubacterium sp.]